MRVYREESSSGTQIYWGTFYRYIFLANQVLSIIPEVDETDLTPVTKSIMRYKATALAIRSFAYTNLMSLYQDDDMVLFKNVTKTSMGVNSQG